MKFFPHLKHSRTASLALLAALIAPVLAAPAQQPQVSVGSTRDVSITFTGATRFNESQLRAAIADQIDEIRGSGLNGASADDTAFFLSLFYHKNGYPLAEVKSSVKPGNRLILSITEGVPAAVQEIIFSGNQSVPSNILRDYLLGATSERFSRMKKTLPYISSDIATGVERIRGHYQSEGFLDSVVDEPVTTFSADKTRVLIAVKIHEGTQCRFGKIGFTGDLIFYPQKDLLDELTPFTDKPFTQTQLLNLQRKVVYFYRSRGYFDVKIGAESDSAQAKNGLVPVNLNVVSGNVYRFGDVHVSGLDRLRPAFLPKRFAKLRGKFYSPEKLDEVFQEMMRTGLFKSLKIDSKPQPSNQVDLDIAVEEAPAKEIGFPVGCGTFEGFIAGIHLADRDLFGSGRPASATFEFSQKLLKGEFTYTDPWFLDTQNTLKLRVYTLNQDWQGYSKFEIGFRGELSRNLTKNLQATAFLLTRQVAITDNGIPVRELGTTNYFVNSLGLSLTLDLRGKSKNPSRPAKGFLFVATGEFAPALLGTTVPLARATMSASYYLPLKNSLLAFSARGGIVHPLTDLGIPIDERFFNGGSRSVRSFAERELGPKDIYGNPVGGETFSVFNIEYTFPLYGDLDAALVADAGSVGRQLDTDALGDLGYGIGAGLRYNLPIGPLRLDYGYNPSPKRDEAIGAFHFSFGFAF